MQLVELWLRLSKGVAMGVWVKCYNVERKGQLSVDM